MLYSFPEVFVLKERILVSSSLVLVFLQTPAILNRYAAETMETTKSNFWWDDGPEVKNRET